MKTCVVIPVYNHERAIGAVVEDLRVHALPVILVDDGSSPECRAVLEELATRESSWVCLVKLPENLGKGGAVSAGLREANTRGFTHAVQIDADGQHRIADLPRFLQTSADHPDAVISGQPVFDASVPKGRLYGRYLTHIWVWINTLSFDIKDSMCGYRVYPLARVVALIDRARIGQRMDFDVELLVRLHWAGVEIRQIPTPVTYPSDGVSHFEMFNDNARLTWMQTRLFFGMVLRTPVIFWRKLFGQPWEQRPTHWARMGERGSVVGMQLMVLAYRIFGRGLFTAILYPVMLYYFLAVSRARRGSLEYLQRLSATAPGLGLKPTWGLSFKHFVSLGQVMLDKVLIFSGGITLNDVTAHAREVMNERVSRGQGGVVLTAHVGNLEAMQALSEDNPNLRLTILVHTKHAASFNRILEKAKPTRKPTLVEVTDFTPDVAMNMADRVAAGEWIVVAADRVPVSSDRSVDANFLGARAPFPAGPHVLAGVLGCPMMLVVALKQNGRYHVHYELLTERLEWSRATRNAVLAESVQRFADRLSHYCELAPLQWFNFFPFWHQS